MKTEQQLRALAISRKRDLLEHLKRALQVVDRITLGAINVRDMQDAGETIGHAQRCFGEFAVLANVLEDR